jgi:hypothetical protein
MDSLNRPDSMNSSVVSYEELYDLTYPEQVQSITKLKDKLQIQRKIHRILYLWDDICADVSKPERIINHISEENFPTVPRTLWLFWDNEHLINATKDLIKLAVKLNDPKLTEGDYSLLLFLSYQDNETKALTESLPLDLLHDMYDPFGESKFKEWYEVQHAALDSKG